MNSDISNLRSRMGFTLVEVTIAITLVALIAMTLYGAIHLSQRAMAKSQARSEESQRLRSVGDLLAGYIRSAYPYRPSRGAAPILFSGKEAQLTFVSALSSGMGGRGMSEITISWDGEGEGRGILGLEESMPVSLKSQAEHDGYKNRAILAQGVRELRIEYLDPQGEEERWGDQWDGNERRTLPRAVRLSYREENGEEIQWTFPIMLSVLAP